MEKFKNNITSNTEVVTISRAEYETLQAKLKDTENWIGPIYNLMHKEICKQTVLHADETTLQVLKEKGKSSTSKS